MRGGFPVEISMSLVDAKAHIAALSRFTEYLSDLTGFFRDYLTPTWYALMLRRYNSEGRYAGQKWRALSDRYAAWKMRHYPGQSIGVLSGKTKASLTSPFDVNSMYSVSRKSFVVGTRLNYPMYLQTGTRRMPARPPVQVDSRFRSDVMRLLHRFVADKAQEARKG